MDILTNKVELEKPDTVNLKVNLEQNFVQIRKMVRQFRNKCIPDVPEKLRADTTSFESSAVKAQQEFHISRSSSVKKDGYLNPTTGSFCVETSRDCGICQRRKVLSVDATSLPNEGKYAGRKGSSGTQNFGQSKVRSIPKTVFIDPYALAESDCWYQNKKNMAVGAVNSSAQRIGNDGGVFDPEEMYSVNTCSSPGFRSKYKVGNIITRNGISGSTVRSMWL